MTVNREKLQFYSEDTIDKIVDQGEVTIVNDGVSANNSVSKITSLTIPNPYGKPLLARARWSIDNGATWQSMEAKIFYTYTITFTDVDFTSPPQPGLRAAVSVGANANVLGFRTANGYHGNVSRKTTAAPSTGYNPIKQTFRIQYWFYEVD